MKLLFNYSLLGFLLVIFSCCAKQGPLSSNKENLNGFNLSLTPNTTDKVGSIFAIRRNEIFFIDTVGGLTPIQGKIAIAKIDNNKKTSTKAIANFVNASPSVTANASFQNTKELETSFNIQNATVEKLSLIQATPRVKEKRIEILNFIKDNPFEGPEGYEFFLITETISSNNINFEFGKETNGNAGIEGAFQEIANANAGVTWEKNNNSSLNYQYEEPLIILFKAFKIRTSGSLIGEEFQISIDTDSPKVGTGNSLYSFEN